MLKPLTSLAGAAAVFLTIYAIGLLHSRKNPVPFEIRLALGAVWTSLLIFALLAANAVHWSIILALCLASIVAVWALRPPRKPFDKLERIPGLIFSAYGLWYFVNALAPETTPDGVTYHLGLVREYVRLGGFPDRIAFYDMVPQGMEMLFTAAYSIGRHPAAKLVEFAFFLATLPLILRLGPRLGLNRPSSILVAVAFFCAPIAGLTGSSSYNDAAGVFFLLAALYLMLDARWLAAGMCAGFCYAIKMPGLLVPACGLVWLLATRRIRSALAFSAGSLLGIAPWMCRAAMLTGNPLAPLANAFFPNPYFHLVSELELGQSLRSMRGVAPALVPWQLALGDRFDGVYGPLLLALPLGLLALRRRPGSLLWLAAAALAIPWFTNTGARFLMQPFVLAAFALAMVLPPRIAWVAIALQAVICWPHVLDRIQPPYSFRLHEFPAAAALGIESEDNYLRRRLDDYKIARLIESSTPPDSHTLALLSVANAYLDRDVSVSWQSAQAETLLDTLRLAALYTLSPVYDWRAEWPARDVRALRFRMPSSREGEWDLNEIQILSGETLIANSPQWTYSGKPNRWESPLAFDLNLATRWRTWEPVRAGTNFEVNFGHPQRLTAARLVTHTPVLNEPVEVWGETSGSWSLLGRVTATPRAPQDLRLDAARALRRAGYRYVLTPTGSGGNAPIGNAISGREAEWGMEIAAEAGNYLLLRIR